MNVFKAIVICAVSIIFPTEDLSPRDWRGLRPLHSTCDDVKRALGVTTCKPPDSTYDLGDEKVKITFSSVLCEKAWQKLWNVKPGTVLSIERSLRKRIPLAKFNINEDKYHKLKTDFTDQLILVSTEEGVEFSVINGDVDRITYMPTRKDDHLLCPSSLQPPKRVLSEDFLPWFDRYGNLAFKQEKKRLDQFARELRAYIPPSKGYIVVYAGRNANERETKVRAERARNYLKKAHQLDVEALAGGHREKLTVELYISPRGTPP